MPTPGEQKALIFLGAVALLGGAVRLLGGDPPPEATPGERAALGSQIVATDSAALARRAEKATRGKRPRKRATSSGTDTSAIGAPPSIVERGVPATVDVDQANEEALTALPGIGPALAARIVADRKARGPFGSLEALDGVSGVGPALIRRLAPHVTFSGPPRPSTADDSGGGVRASGRVVGLIGGRP